MEDVTQISAQVTELAYALDTFYFLVCGALVMWMAAGFTMLESGLVRAKNTAEILTKNVGLYSIACIMFMLVGYTIMYPSDASNLFLQFGDGLLGSSDNSAEDVIATIRAGARGYHQIEDTGHQHPRCDGQPQDEYGDESHEKNQKSPVHAAAPSRFANNLASRHTSMAKRMIIPVMKMTKGKKATKMMNCPMNVEGVTSKLKEIYGEEAVRLGVGRQGGGV